MKTRKQILIDFITQNDVVIDNFSINSNQILSSEIVIKFTLKEDKE